MQNNKRFEEQEAPEKNTDHAFVKVGEDGKPEMPGNTDQKTSTEKTEKKESDSINEQRR